MAGLGSVELHSAKVSPDKARGAATNKNKPVEKTRDFDRRDFHIDGSDIGEKRKGLFGKDIKTNEGVKIPERVEIAYRAFLQDHYRKLARLEQEAPGILKGKKHKYDKLFFDALKGADGKLNGDNLTAFLKNPRGWEITAVLNDHQIALSEMAYGMVTETKFGAVDNALEPPSKLRKAVKKHLPKENEYRAWKFNALKGDPNEALYVKVMTGVDINDFKVDGGKVVLDKKATGGTSEQNPEAIRDKIKGLRRTRQLFLNEGLGVKNRYIDMSAEEWLQRKRRPLDGLTMYRETMKHMPALDPADGQKNLRNFMKAREQGLSVMMEQYFEDIGLSPEVKLAQQKLDALTTIATGAETRKQAEQSKITDKMTHLATDRTGRLEGETGIKKPFDTLQQKLDEVEAQRQAAINIGAGDGSITSINVERVNLQEKIDGIDTVTKDFLPTSVAYRRRAVIEERDKYASGEIGKLDVALYPPGGVRRSAKADEIQQSWERRYKKRVEDFNTEEVELQKKINELTTAEKTIRDAESVLTSTRRENPWRLAQEAQRKADGSFTTLRSFGAGTTLEITEDNLRDMSVGQVLERITEIHVSTTPGGTWPEALNTADTQRKEVLAAMTEAQARKTVADYNGNPLTAANEGHFKALTEIGVATPGGPYKVPEVLLLSRPLEDVKADMLAHGVATLPSDDEIRRSQEYAKKRWTAYDEALDTVDKKLQKEITERETEKAKVDYSADAAKSKMIQSAARRQDKLNEMGEKMVEDKKGYAEAKLTGLADKDPEFTQAEKDKKVPRGYLKAMDDWFGYQLPKVEQVTVNGTTTTVTKSREQQFEEVFAFMPPDRYADLMNKHLGLGVKPGGTFTKDVFDAMGKKLGKRLDARAVRSGMRAAMTELMDTMIATVKP